MTIYQHFRPEEHAFIDQVLEWKELVMSNYSPKLSDFLDPREQHIVKSVIGQNQDVQVQFLGGSDQLERQRALFYPDYYVPELIDFQLKLFEVEYPHKFVTIEHPQVLGSLMSLGLKRAKYGDILFDNERVQIIVAKEVADFIQMNLHSIGRAKVTLIEKEFTALLPVVEEWKEEFCTASSLRLDVLIAEAYNLSRSKASPLIKGGVVKVNWKQVEETSFECREGDMLSVRGFGRCKIIEIEGKTKRDKYRLKLGKAK
ncbi:RNA-binding protein [Bacillus pinisoli]|uniref:YlmH family RNA-binding protein n=1 Tax=Bacillus pinisoli TaxID=2901866 RepID=UPI001FF447F4|nr:RNA-binding protein [Bacillus pinisoli]